MLTERIGDVTGIMEAVDMRSECFEVSGDDFPKQGTNRRDFNDGSSCCKSRILKEEINNKEDQRQLWRNKQHKKREMKIHKLKRMRSSEYFEYDDQAAVDESDDDIEVKMENSRGKRRKTAAFKSEELFENDERGRFMANESVKTSNDSGKRVLSNRKLIMPQKFNGLTPLNIYLAQFEICSEYNGWKEEDKAAYLKTSLRGKAALLIFSSATEHLSYAELVLKLKQFFEPCEQAAFYRMQLRERRRKKNESIQNLYQDIVYLSKFAFPGEPSDHSESITMDAFLDSLDDDELELRIRSKEPRDLHEAYTLAVTLESYSNCIAMRRNVEVQSDLSSDEAIEVKSSVSEPQFKRPSCFNCNEFGHFARCCKGRLRERDFDSDWRQRGGVEP